MEEVDRDIFHPHPVGDPMPKERALAHAPEPQALRALCLRRILPLALCRNPKLLPSTSWLWRRSWSASTKTRSEEHTSELQSRLQLVCRLLLEKKKEKATNASAY